MKRTPLARSGWLQRKTPLRSRRPGPPRRRPADIALDERYKAWVRARRCCARGLSACRGRRDPHHAGPGSGMGQTASDHTCICLCRRHHDELHAAGGPGGGPFREMTRAEVQAWEQQQIDETQADARACGLLPTET